MTLAKIEALVRSVPWVCLCEYARHNRREMHGVCPNKLPDYLAIAAALHAAWEREVERIMVEERREQARLINQRDAAEARVKELEQSMIGHFQREHLEGDGPEIDRWKARVKELEAERDELRRLIETGASRGAPISPFVRRVFAAGSQAAKERDLAEARLRDLEAKLEGDMSVREASLLEERDALKARLAALWEEAATIAEQAAVGQGTSTNTRDIWRHEMGQDLARQFRLRATAADARRDE